MIPSAKPTGIQTTGMMQNPISHPTTACSFDLFGAAAFAFQIAKTLNNAQRAIQQRLIITEPALWHSPLRVKAHSPFMASRSPMRTPRAKNDPSPNRNPRFCQGPFRRARYRHPVRQQQTMATWTAGIGPIGHLTFSPGRASWQQALYLQDRQQAPGTQRRRSFLQASSVVEVVPKPWRLYSFRELTLRCVHGQS
jgi:hypothetical protein